MMITIPKIIDRTGGILLTGSSPYGQSDFIDDVVTDSRLLIEGGDYSHTAFIAVKGENFDGNDFIEPAVKAGVRLVVAGPDSEKARRALRPGGGTVIIICGDTLKAYGDIASVWRESLGVTVIGVTGSVGKTTAKEFVYKAVYALGRTVKTPRNHNNEIGVPRTVLGTDPETDYAVIEMGMRGRGQIHALANIARPKIGIITNIGTAHLEILGTKENTRLAKLEIADFMGKSDFLLVNGDDSLLKDAEKVLKASGRKEIPKIYKFGFSEDCFFRASNTDVALNSTDFDFFAGGSFVKRVSLGVVGEHFVYGALAGLGAAFLLGASRDDIENRVIPEICSVLPEDTGRQMIFDLPGGMLIDDCYNASPEAVRAEIGVLKKLSGKAKKAAFLGDMLELGGVSREEHRSIGALCADFGIDKVICVGERARDIKEGAPEGCGTEFICFENSGEAAERAPEMIERGSAVLVKGSHAMHMEVISERIKEIFKN